MIAADEAVAAELDARGQIDGSDPTLRQIQDFVQQAAPSTPGYSFVAATCYAAGKAAGK